VSFVSKTTPYLNPDLIFKVFYQASLKYKSTTNVTLALTEKKKNVTLADIFQSKVKDLVRKIYKQIFSKIKKGLLLKYCLVVDQWAD
jgi:hypothetical protein